MLALRVILLGHIELWAESDGSWGCGVKALFKGLLRSRGVIIHWLYQVATEESLNACKGRAPRLHSWWTRSILRWLEEELKRVLRSRDHLGGCHSVIWVWSSALVCKWEDTVLQTVMYVPFTGVRKVFKVRSCAGQGDHDDEKSRDRCSDGALKSERKRGRDESDDSRMRWVIFSLI